MKTISIIPGAALILLLAGCSTTPVALAPVGPNPVGPQTASAEGSLEVFSFKEQQSDNQNQGSTDPVWYQHTDYEIYSANGGLLERVDNTVGHYAQAPRVVNLPAGKYFVQAYAVNRLPVRVPVTVKRGHITRIHLDDNWKPPMGIVKTETVSLPGGQPVGWQTNAVQ